MIGDATLLNPTEAGTSAEGLPNATNSETTPSRKWPNEVKKKNICRGSLPEMRIQELVIRPKTSMLTTT